MEYIVIGICLIAIVAIGARIFFKPKSKDTVTPTVSVSPKEDEELSLSAPQGESAHDLVIQVEMLPAEAIPTDYGRSRHQQHKFRIDLKVLLIRFWSILQKYEPRYRRGISIAADLISE